MSKVPAVTFKKDKPPGGLMNVGWRAGAAIKTRKQEVGRICPPAPFGEDCYRVLLYVVDIAEPSGFKNIVLKYKGKSLDETKEWVKSVWEQLYTKYKFKGFA